MTATLPGPVVEPARHADLEAVRAAYAEGARRQRAASGAVWPPVADALLEAEVREGRLWTVRADGRLQGVFSAVYRDPVIWGARDRGAHVYLHRISRAPGGAGGLMGAVATWALAHAAARGLEGVRLDTWAGNEALLAHYERWGFARVGRRSIPADEVLPAHYWGIEVVLMERPVLPGGVASTAPAGP